MPSSASLSCLGLVLSASCVHSSLWVHDAQSDLFGDNCYVDRSCRCDVVPSGSAASNLHWRGSIIGPLCVILWSYDGDISWNHCPSLELAGHLRDSRDGDSTGGIAVRVHIRHAVVKHV